MELMHHTANAARAPDLWRKKLHQRSPL